MTTVRFFEPENRLGKAIAAPGGKQIELAIADAEEQVMLAAEESASKIDEILDTIYGLCSNTTEPPLDALYPSVREVAGLAGIANLKDLGIAAHTFCGMIDLAKRAGGLGVEQLQVNIGVLRLLRRPERFSDAERKGLLDNLHSVLDKAMKTANGG